MHAEHARRLRTLAGHAAMPAAAPGLALPAVGMHDILALGEGVAGAGCMAGAGGGSGHGITRGVIASAPSSDVGNTCPRGMARAGKPPSLPGGASADSSAELADLENLAYLPTEACLWTGMARHLFPGWFEGSSSQLG